MQLLLLKNIRVVPILYTNNTSDLDAAAKEIIAAGKDYPIWFLIGSMGAGKTTLVAAIMQALGSTDLTSSPTYALVNEYSYPNDKIAYHFDLYRLKTIEEALDMGIEEYLHSGHLCLIEWPQLIEPLLDTPVFVIEISILEQEKRAIKTYSKHG
ncbi:MAG: tRNA (adenosine(37)-N6)-threonylcarbamoyltransferase complex ATPase subunit type 1 TsaE [Luteibaculaceae bacterium]